MSYIDPSLPTKVREFLSSGGKLETITLKANGEWLHQGYPIENPRISALFSRSVTRTSGGSWILEIPPFSYPITVECTPFFITKLTVNGSVLEATLSDETVEIIEPQQLYYDGKELLITPVKGLQYNARFSKRAYYTAAELLDEEDGKLGVRVAGEFFPLNTIDNELKKIS